MGEGVGGASRPSHTGPAWNHDRVGKGTGGDAGLANARERQEKWRESQQRWWGWGWDGKGGVRIDWMGYGVWWSLLSTVWSREPTAQAVYSKALRDHLAT